MSKSHPSPCSKAEKIYRKIKSREKLVRNLNIFQCWLVLLCLILTVLWILPKNFCIRHVILQMIFHYLCPKKTALRMLTALPRLTFLLCNELSVGSINPKTALIKNKQKWKTFVAITDFIPVLLAISSASKNESSFLRMESKSSIIKE